MLKPGKQFAGVQALIFDLDGTLIDSKLDLALAVNATRNHMGLPQLDHPRIFSYVGSGAQALIRRAMEEGVSEAEVERALAYFLAYYRAHMLDNTVPYPGVREGLQMLSSRAMAVLTNKPVRFSRAILEGLGLARYFRAIYGGNSFERKKPDPIGVQHVLAEFALTPLQAMVVGDSEIDVQTARNAGTWVAGVTYGLGSAGLAEFPPDLLIASLSELPAFLPGLPEPREEIRTSDASGLGSEE